MRIARDKARRREKKRTHNQEADNFHNVINHQAYVSSLKKCQKSVSYKSSVQRYVMRAVTHMDETIEMVSSGKLPPLTSKDRIKIYERGKARTIFPVAINDRITQRALCDVAMVPIISRTLIYNNGAKKTKIVKATRGFVFMKVRYRVTKDAKIIRTLARTGITRMRRKLKKLYKKCQAGLLTLDNVFDSIQSWLAHAKVAKAYHTVKSMLKLYNRLFGGYRITHKYFKAQKKLKQGGGNGELLQVDKWRDFRWDCQFA